MDIIKQGMTSLSAGIIRQAIADLKTFDVESWQYRTALSFLRGGEGDSVEVYDIVTEFIIIPAREVDRIERERQNMDGLLFSVDSVQELTGYQESIIRRWIHSHHIKPKDGKRKWFMTADEIREMGRELNGGKDPVFLPKHTGYTIGQAAKRTRLSEATVRHWATVNVATRRGTRIRLTDEDIKKLFRAKRNRESWGI